MRISICAMFCALILSFSALAQDYVSDERLPADLPLLRMNEALMGSGPVVENIPLGSMREYQKLAPGSEILARDLSFFSSEPSTGYSGSYLSIQSGFAIRNREKTGYHPGRSLRLGVQYFSQRRYTYYAARSITSPWDTLTSAQTGEQILLDSLHRETLTFDYRLNTLRFDAAILFSTINETRWSWFGGIGFTFGPSLSSESSVSYTSSRNTQVRDSSTSLAGFMNSDDNTQIETEIHTLKTALGGSVYIPAGIDFRVGKRREFWKPVHLFYEIRPQIMYTSIPELGSTLRGGIQQAFGLRIKWR